MRVALRGVVPSDIVALYLLHTGPDGYLTRLGGTTPSLEAFQRVLFDGVLVQMIVDVPQEQRIAGLVTMYGYNPRDATCLASLVSTTRQPDRIRTILGLLVLCEHAFDRLSLRKIYFEIPEYNLHRFRSALGRLVLLEAVLPDRHVLHARTWSQMICSISREAFQLAEIQRLLVFAHGKVS